MEAKVGYRSIKLLVVDACATSAFLPSAIIHWDNFGRPHDCHCYDDLLWQDPLSVQLCVFQNSIPSSPVITKAYDYIIVGGGTAGCPLAATLSLNYSVLVVERGDSPYGVPSIENMNNFLVPLKESDEYNSVAQTFVTEEGVDGARGRVLGGSSALNAGFYSRASVEFIGEMGWDEKVVKESYEWVEGQVAYRPERLGPWQSAVKDALLEVGVLPFNGYSLEHLEGTKIGASTFDSNGKRHTAADLLNHATADNIVVLLNATIKRILFHPSETREEFSGKPRATGVEFVNREGVSHKAFLKQSGEVILCAGAIGSPQLLLLSGIGPSAHLSDFGIPVIVDLPGVGQGIADNPLSNIDVPSRLPVESSMIQVVGILNHSQIYIEASSFILKVPMEASSKDLKSGDESIKDAYIGSFIEKVAHPLSTGELRLRTLDPRDNPSVRFNYYSHPLDLQTCVDATKMFAKLLESKSLQGFVYKNASAIPDYLLPEFSNFGPPLPTNTSDDAAMARYCWDTLKTIWHYHGGCKIGSVINERYEVMGVDGLRVVDASTFMSSPGTNPQATTMMLGRYEGLQILQERLRSINTFPETQIISSKRSNNSLDHIICNI